MGGCYYRFADLGCEHDVVVAALRREKDPEKVVVVAGREMDMCGCVLGMCGNVLLTKEGQLNESLSSQATLALERAMTEAMLRSSGTAIHGRLTADVRRMVDRM